MKAFLARLERRLIKAKINRTDSIQFKLKGEKRVLPAFLRAARFCPAYRTLLSEASVDPTSIRTIQDFEGRCPLLQKSNTFNRFGIDQLICDDTNPGDLASVLTSSGHGGSGFAFGISTRKQLDSAPWLIDLGLEMAFDVDTRRTLLVNCLPMGVVFNSRAVCVANVSVREDMACAIIKKAGHLFDQLVICGDPLFLKLLCDYSRSIGLDWSRYRVNVIIGEETFPETFRNYLSGVLALNPDRAEDGLIGSSMGIAELGLNLFNETRETVALRRKCARDPAFMTSITGLDSAVEPTPTFLVYNPLRTWVEVVNCDSRGVGDLVVTILDPSVPVPLMRYNTGDRAQWISEEVFGEVASSGSAVDPPPFPVLALHGRAKDFLLGRHIDLFKEVIYSLPSQAHSLSGAHRLSSNPAGLLWELQAGRNNPADLVELSVCLQQAAERRVGMPLRAVCFPYSEYPFGQRLDYERKFSYCGPHSSQ